MVKEWNKINFFKKYDVTEFCQYNDYTMWKLVPLPHEWRERGWINYRKYIIDLTSFSMYKHFSNTCKWYLLFVSDNFAEKWVLKIVNWIYILLGSDHVGNFFPKVITTKTLFVLAKPLAIDHLGNFFPEVITTKTLFALGKRSAIADCQAQFRRLNQ